MKTEALKVRSHDDALGDASSRLGSCLSTGGNLTRNQPPLSCTWPGARPCDFTCLPYPLHPRWSTNLPLLSDSPTSGSKDVWNSCILVLSRYGHYLQEAPASGEINSPTCWKNQILSNCNSSGHLANACENRKLSWKKGTEGGYIKSGVKQRRPRVQLLPLRSLWYDTRQGRSDMNSGSWEMNCVHTKIVFNTFGLNP